MRGKFEEGIAEIAGRYPAARSAIVPALELGQKENGGFLTSDAIRAVGDHFGVPACRAFGVATYYTLLNTRPVGKYHLQVDTNVPAFLAGADEIVEHLHETLGIGPGETTPDGLFTLSCVEDLGAGGTCPVVQVNDIHFNNVTIRKVDEIIASLRAGLIPPPDTTAHWRSECNILLKNRGSERARDVAAYVDGGGYRALVKALSAEPARIVEEVKASMLRGRGGAGFPTGIKWGFLPKNDPRPVYMICNADEGEPGTFKDRQIMEYDPHLLIEGMAIAAHAVGAGKAFIYIRGEFGWIADILERAVAQAAEAGHTRHVDIVVHRGAGSYVCGEETALIESIEGKRGLPRIKPPFPANVGLYGCPTVVNNVETLANLPYIVEHGADAYRGIGRTNNFGPKLYCVSGHVARPGVYEYPLGTPLATVLAAAGGARGRLKGVIPGGLSVPILTADEAQDLNLDFDGCLEAGTMLGSGGIIVLSDTVSIPRLALRTIRFYEHESCGQCTPCREGSHAISSLVEKLVSGRGKADEIDLVLKMCRTIKGLTLCPMGDAFAVPMEAMVRKFRPEFDALVR